MKRSYKYLVIIFILVINLGCSTSRKPVVTQTTTVIEKDRILSKSFDAVWLSAIEWFATHNTPIKNLDKFSGLISTEYSVPIGEASKYMWCGNGSSSFTGKVEISNYTGNFNVLIKKVSEVSTKVSINVFFGCSVNKYKYKSILSTEYVLESSTRINCSSTGLLEREILNYLEAAN